MTYIIGDIHGESEKLIMLLTNIRLFDKKPLFIFVGDYIDKGLDPKKTLDFLQIFKTYNDCVFLIGNHEYAWMNLTSTQNQNNFTTYLEKYGGDNTISSFGENDFFNTQKRLMDDYHSFFSSLKPYYIINNYFICHSGISQVNYLRQPTELESRDFLFNRYDFLKTDTFYCNKYIMIFGHTPFYYPYIDTYKIGIDTAAFFYKERPLTSFCVETKIFLNSNNQNKHLSDFSLNICPNIVRFNPMNNF